MSSLPAYFKQQTRWSVGTISAFTKLIWYFFKGPSKLSFWQWWEYFLAGSYYFVSWAFFSFMICPIVYLMFGLPSFFAHPEVFIAAYLPFIFMSMLVFYSTMKKRHYKIPDLYLGTILGLVSFSVLMRSAIYGLIVKRMTFVVTTKGKMETMTLLSMWPWIAMIMLNLSACTCGVFKMIYEPAGSIIINMFWAVYHVFVLSNIFYLNNSRIKDIVIAVMIILPAAFIIGAIVYLYLSGNYMLFS